MEVGKVEEGVLAEVRCLRGGGREDTGRGGGDGKVRIRRQRAMVDDEQGSAD